MIFSKSVIRLLNRFGYSIEKSGSAYADLEPAFKKIYEQCQHYTMTSTERMYALFQAIQYIEANQIAGDFVECGVWKGGSSMLAAKTFKLNNSTDRNLYLYDTFEGMSKPGDKDFDMSGKQVNNYWNEVSKEDKIFCYSTLEEVERNMTSGDDYPRQKIFFVKGKVEDTIPATIPNQIALLRLDTDWYESTRHELIHLYPLLSKGGVLIIDDYGHWKGARDAVDEYFKKQNLKPLLNRIDYTGRMMIKT